MELNNLLKGQIVDIKTAKIFKALGLLQTSLFYYVNYWRGPTGLDVEDGQHVIDCHEQHLTRIAGRKRLTEVEFVSAYTLAEVNAFLLDMKCSNITDAVFRVKEFTLPEFNRHIINQGDIDFRVMSCNRQFRNNFKLDTDGQHEI